MITIVSIIIVSIRQYQNNLNFSVGPIVDTYMQFALIHADPSVFTLSFNSSNGPPTVVECARDGQALDTSSYNITREVLQAQYLLNGDVDSINASDPDMPDVTRVTLTVTGREAGEYNCTVTVLGRKDNIPQQVVTLGTGLSTAVIISNVTVQAAYARKSLSVMFVQMYIKH